MAKTPAGHIERLPSGSWRNQVAAGLRDAEVTPPQFFVLVTLLRMARREGSGITQRHVAARTRMDANTMSQIVRGLRRRGLLTQSPHPDDSRAVTLALTTPGTELARDCAARVRAINTEFFASIDQPVLGEALTTFLDKADHDEQLHDHT
jgi:MarR family transcriptional regulator, organic hydroperoxide resistance regulator